MFIGRCARIDIVGYQNKGFENARYNISAATFVPVGGSRDTMTLGDIKPSEDFVNSAISFMTPGGATAKVTFQGSQVSATYVYWTEDDEPEAGEAGWYLYDDDDATVNQNGVVIPFGTGFLVNRNSSEVDATLCYAGEVDTEPVTKSFPSARYNIAGNCSPTQITLGDITPNATFVNSAISFMTPGGATAKVMFQGAEVSATYVYWTEDDEPEAGEAGWYLYDDDDATVNQNGVVLAAGQGFLVNRNASETDATLTIPSAL